MTKLDALVRELARHAPTEAEASDRRQAAVALLLTGAPDRLLLIRRAERAGDPWSGHLALPGGRRDADDPDLLDTAIRETVEETGITLAREAVVAQLDDVVPATPVLPPLVVRPFVFRLSTATAPILNAEVEHAVWVPLDQLTAEGVYRRRVLDVGGRSRAMFGYQLPEGFLWGITERIVTPVLRRWAGDARGV